MKVLTRLWQMLLKGVQEVQTAPKAVVAADMVLVRLCYAADLPTPDDLIRQLAEGGGGSSARAAVPAPAPCRPTRPRAAPWRCPGAAAPSLPQPQLQHSRSPPRPRGPRARLLRRRRGAGDARSATCRSSSRSSGSCASSPSRTAESISPSRPARRRPSPTISAASSPTGRTGAGWSSSRPIRERRPCATRPRRGRPSHAGRRPGRSAGAGGDGALSGCRDRRRARQCAGAGGRYAAGRRRRTIDDGEISAKTTSEPAVRPDIRPEERR